MPGCWACLNVQYVITDKVRDLWFEDVYYDRQIGVRLGPSGLMEAEAAVPYPFEATHVDLIGYVEADMQALAQGNRIATVTARGGRRRPDCSGRWLPRCARGGAG